MTIEQALAHAGDLDTVDLDVMEEIEAALPHYLWIIDGWTSDTGLMEYDEPDPRNPSRLVHCGECGYERVEKSKRGVYVDKYPQSDFCVCPFCGERLEVKHVSRGIKHIYHRLNVVFFRRSEINRKVVVALAARCTRSYQHADYRAPWELEPDVDVRGVAVFDPTTGEDIRIQRYEIWQEICDTGHYDIVGHMWKQVKAMTRLGFGDDGAWEWQKADTICLKSTLDEAIEGTPLKRSWCYAYEVGDCVEALHMALKYPCVEYMTKLGCVRFLPAKLRGEMETGMINWNGKSMAKVFRISQARLGQAKGKKITLTPELCAVLQYVDREGIPCGIETAEGVATVCGQGNRTLKRDLDMTLNMFQPSRRAKALKYMAKHANRRLTAFRDLWRMTLDVGGSLDSDAEAFPKDFDAVHDRLAARVKVKNSAHLNKLIENNLPRLTKKLGFEFGGLVLRPVASVEELLREGEQLHHCVGSYASKYAQGETVICVLRRTVDPDRPWRTVEISATTGRVIQDRGLHNDWGKYQIDDKYQAMLRMFWEAWGERRRHRGKADERQRSHECDSEKSANSA